MIYCADYHCSHSIAIRGDRWPDDVRLSDIEVRFICGPCGKRGADVRPDFSWNAKPVGRRTTKLFPIFHRARNRFEVEGL